MRLQDSRHVERVCRDEVGHRHAVADEKLPAVHVRFHDSRHVDEIVLRLAGDVSHDRRGQCTQVRQVLLDEMVNAVVIESDGIQHAGRRLHGSRRRVAGTRVARYGLGDDAAQTRKIDHPSHFLCVAEGA